MFVVILINRRGEDVKRFNPPFDFIIASDVGTSSSSSSCCGVVSERQHVVYQEEFFEVLVNCMAALSDVDTKIVLSYKKRSKEEAKFFDLLSKKFTWTQVSLFTCFRIESLTVDG